MKLWMDNKGSQQRRYRFARAFESHSDREIAGEKLQLFDEMQKAPLQDIADEYQRTDPEAALFCLCVDHAAKTDKSIKKPRIYRHAGHDR